MVLDSFFTYKVFIPMIIFLGPSLIFLNYYQNQMREELEEEGFGFVIDRSKVDKLYKKLLNSQPTETREKLYKKYTRWRRITIGALISWGVWLVIVII